ncbi:MAG TPA: serine/threonine-protein kinase [Bryobacteraceae bacterium]|nr:serine/threonine-protein kinase [Bryobacteraceae bacterium]
MVNLAQFGKYEIIRKLSRSLTDVYLAFDAEADRQVVLKLVEHSRDDFTPVVIAAERRGAAIQKELHNNDPRILEIFDAGDLGDCFFVAMEYFPGKTLAEILREEQRVEPKRAARYTAEVCSQLRTLHSFISDINGRRTAVVHGDIKPSNIQIGSNDDPRLLDFGIAKVITFTHNLTHHNLGSPSYCSPERLSKAQVDADSDLWALGVTLYELVSGAPPYQAQDTRKLENLIQSGRPVRALPDDCPAPLRTVIAKSLAPNKDRRYPSAEEFERDLRAFVAGEPVAAAMEKQDFWNANDTINKAREQAEAVRGRVSKPTAIRVAALKLLPKRKTNTRKLLIASCSGLIVGLIAFMPFAYSHDFERQSDPLRGHKDYAQGPAEDVVSDWNLYRGLHNRGGLMGRFSSDKALDTAFHNNLTAAADSIISEYRNASDRDPSGFDWTRARLCLRYALAIHPSDSEAKGKLALCNGYAALPSDMNRHGTETSIRDFRLAASLLPHSPDPHLALARVYIYSYRNLVPALAELHQAEQLGYRLGPPDIKEEGDGYLIRARWELLLADHTSPWKSRLKWLARAHGDIEHADELYRPISPLANVSASLERLNQYREEQARLESETPPVAMRSSRAGQRLLSSRAWR